MVREARDLVRGEEASAVVGFVRGAFWILSQRGRAMGGRMARPGSDDAG